MLHGEGRWIVTGEDGVPILEYKGSFKDDKYDGFGQLALADGAIYTG